VWFEELSNAIKIGNEIADREGVTDRYVSQVLELAFVAPSLVEEILEGSNSRVFTTRRLTLQQSLPTLWKDQMVSPPLAALRFSASPSDGSPLITQFIS